MEGRAAPADVRTLLDEIHATENQTLSQPAKVIFSTFPPPLPEAKRPRLKGLLFSKTCTGVTLSSFSLTSRLLKEEAITITQHTIQIHKQTQKNLTRSRTRPCIDGRRYTQAQTDIKTRTQTDTIGQSINHDRDIHFDPLRKGRGQAQAFT